MTEDDEGIVALFYSFSFRFNVSGAFSVTATAIANYLPSTLSLLSSLGSSSSINLMRLNLPEFRLKLCCTISFNFKREIERIHPLCLVLACWFWYLTNRQMLRSNVLLPTEKTCFFTEYIGTHCHCLIICFHPRRRWSLFERCLACQSSLKSSGGLYCLLSFPLAPCKNFLALLFRWYWQPKCQLPNFCLLPKFEFLWAYFQLLQWFTCFFGSWGNPKLVRFFVWFHNEAVPQFFNSSGRPTVKLSSCGI